VRGPREREESTGLGNDPDDDTSIIGNNMRIMKARREQATLKRKGALRFSESEKKSRRLRGWTKGACHDLLMMIHRHAFEDAGQEG
jgi:hypothetical protein